MTARVTGWAARVLNIGHLPQNSVMPKNEMKANINANVRHSSPGMRIPQNENAVARKPSSDNVQNIMAITFAVLGARLGNNHDRAERHFPPSTPRSMAINAPIAPI